MTNYDRFAETFSNSRKNMVWPEVDKILSDIETHGLKSILDVGCGNGRFLGQLRKKIPSNIEYLGIDSSKGMIDEAQKLYRDENFLVSSMPEFKNLAEKTYDAIILLASFHHLESREARILCLENLKKYLSPGGCVYMTNWNLLDQEKYKKNHRSNGDFDIKIGEFSRYYHGFTLEDLELLLRETGWDIRENRIFEGGRNIYSKFTILN